MMPTNLLQENQRADAFSLSQVSAALDMHTRLEPFNMTSFVYNRIVDDNKYMTIFSLHQLFRDRFGYAADDAFFNTQLENLENNTKFSLWQCSFTDDPSMDYFRQHNVNHGITLYRNHESYKETFHFASTNDNPQILDFYLNNLDVLDNLADDFVDRMGNVLDPTPEKLVHVMRTGNALRPTIYLTNKERLCLQLLKQGYTNKQMARHFGNSPRTIEELVSIIMRKFKVTSRQDFIPIPHRLNQGIN